MRKAVRPSLVLWLALTAVVLLSGIPAHADAIGTLVLTDCGGGDSGCPAATYSFNITSTQATLTIHIDGPVNSNNNLIKAVNLGFSPSNNITNLDLIAAPGGVGGWTETTGSIGNAGCGANNGAFVCAQNIPGFLIAQGGTYVWTWTYTLVDPTKISSGVHVGTNYDPHNGLIVSQTVRTSEPALFTMLGAGLIGLWGLARRSRR